MKSLDEAKQCWNETKSSKENNLHSDEMKDMIRQRIRKEKKIFFEYFWASYIWQFIVYVAMTRLIILFWGDWKAVLICIAGIAMYIPFTMVFIRKFTSMIHRTTASSQSLYTNMKLQWEKMSEFFLFKRRFDWLGIPVSCFILTLITFKLWVPGGWAEHLIGAAIVYLFAIAAFLIATNVENKKRFREPLDKLQLIIKQLEEEL